MYRPRVPGNSMQHHPPPPAAALLYAQNKHRLSLDESATTNLGPSHIRVGFGLKSNN